MNLNFLTVILGSSNPSAVAQTNFELLDTSLAFMLQPSVDGTGLPTIVLGPPTAGTFVLDALWVDALGAIFKCTVAGTPGTWLQLREAVCLNANKPVNPGIPNYLVRIPDDPAVPWKFYAWNAGTSAWVDVT